MPVFRVEKADEFIELGLTLRLIDGAALYIEVLVVKNMCTLVP